MVADPTANPLPKARPRYGRVVAVTPRVVPNGIRDGHLHATILLSPEPVGRMGDAPLTLENWPSSIADTIRDTWKLGLVFHSVAEGGKMGPSVGSLEMKAEGLQRALGSRERAKALDRLWKKSLTENPTGKEENPGDWGTLEAAMSLSATASGMRPGKIAEGDDYEYGSIRTGIDGQITEPIQETGEKSVDTVLAVRHADLALILESQRAAELGLSLREGTGIPGAKAAAELARGKRLQPKGMGTPVDIKPVLGTDKAREDSEDEISQALKSARQAEKIEERRALFKSLKEDNRDKARMAYAAAAKAISGGAIMPPVWQDRYCMEAIGAQADDSRDDAFDTASASHTYASWPQYAHPDDPPGSRADKNDKVAPVRQEKERIQKNANGPSHIERVYFTMQSTPTLARLFCLAIDVRVPIAALKEQGLEDGYYCVGCDFGREEGAPPAARTLARLGPNHFWPVTHEEAAKADADGNADCCPEDLTQHDGFLVMSSGWKARGSGIGAPRFDVTSLDLRTATELECQRRINRQTSVDTRKVDEERDTASEKDAAQEDEDAPQKEDQSTTLLTGGMNLLDRGIQYHTLRKLAANAIKSQVANGTMCLDAEDLTTGYRLDVGLMKGSGTHWTTLTGRTLAFGTSGDKTSKDLVRALLKDLFDDTTRTRERNRIDASSTSIPSRLLPNANDDAASVEAVVDENYCSWDGAPLGVECISTPLDEPTGRYDIFPFGRTASLPFGTPGNKNESTAEAMLPHRMRYGWPYRFAMRATFAGGGSRDVETTRRAGDTLLDGACAYPPRCAGVDLSHVPFVRFLRQHRIEKPMVVMPERHAVPRGLNDDMPDEIALSMIVRSARPLSVVGNAQEQFPLVSDDLKRRATPALAQRIILVPNTSLDEMNRYGQFDAPRTPDSALPNVDFIPEEAGFPVVRATTVEGINGTRFTIDRRVTRPKESDKQTKKESGEPLEGDCDAIYREAQEDTGKFFPDPAAEFLMIGLRRPGDSKYTGDPISVNVENTLRDTQLNLLPVILTILRREGPTTPGKIDVTIDDTALFDPVGPDKAKNIVDIRGNGRPAIGVEIRLAPGEEYEIDLWCRPSKTALVRDFSVLQSLAILSSCKETSGTLDERCLAGLTTTTSPAFAKRVNDIYKAQNASIAAVHFVGPGGATVPSTRVLMAIAEALEDQLSRGPLCEISACQTLEAVHAVNRPAFAPVLAQRPLAGIDWQKDTYPPLPEDALRPVVALRHPLPATAGDTTDKALVCTGGDPTTAPAPVDPAVWRLTSEETGFSLEGDLLIDLDEADGFEIVARMPFPGTSVFDDPERRRSPEHRKAGEWPKRTARSGDPYYRTAQDLFGFHVRESQNVVLPPSTVVLLRVEMLRRPAIRPEGGLTRLRLEEFFKHECSLTDDWQVMHRHVFSDRKARTMTVWARSLSRTAAKMKTANRVNKRARSALQPTSTFELKAAEPLTNADQATPGNQIEVMLPATRRPAKCAANGPLPAFRWTSEPECGGMLTSVTRRSLVRVPLDRGWYSSGQHERVGIVLWPPYQKRGDADIRENKVLRHSGSDDSDTMDLAGFSDEDLGPGGRFVTRIGADPTRHQPMSGGNGAGGSSRHFVDVDVFPKDMEHVPGVVMPLDEADGSQSLTVDLVTCEPRFDPQTERWYVDLDITPFGSAEPFLRIGLTRYQPCTEPALRVSCPIVQWTTLLPERRVSLDRDDNGDVTVTVTGNVGFVVHRNGAGKTVSRPPVMRMRLVREYAGAGSAVMRQVIPNAFAQPEAPGQEKETGYVWSAIATLPEVPLGSRDRYFVYVEEIDRRPGATLAEEPVPWQPNGNEGAIDIGDFSEGGPRFAVRLPIDPVHAKTSGYP